MRMSGCQRRKRKRERIEREAAELQAARQRILGFVTAIAAGATVTPKTITRPDERSDEQRIPTTATMVPRPHGGSAGNVHAGQNPQRSGTVAGAGGAAGSSGSGSASHCGVTGDADEYRPADIAPAKRPSGTRTESGLTLAEEARLNARAVTSGWVKAEFPIHKTAEELADLRRTRALTLAEKLAIANAHAAEKLPNLAPMAARAGAAMALTNAKIHAERQRAEALTMAVNALQAGDEAALDMAEAALLSVGLAGDRHALETFLKAKGRARGYVDRRENVNLEIAAESASELLGRLGLTEAATPSIQARVDSFGESDTVFASETDVRHGGARAPRRASDELQV